MITVFVVVYNMLLSCGLIFAIASTYFLYTQSKLSAHIALGVMFGAYLVDNVIVFCTEVDPRFAEVYDRLFVETPSVKTVYFIILIFSMLNAFSGHVLPKLSMMQLGCLTGIYAAVLICVPMISQNKWMVFFYYLTTQVFFAAISIWGLIALRKSPQREPPFSRKQTRGLLLFLLTMSIFVFAEDTLVINFVDLYLAPHLKIYNRNFSENILFLGLAFFIIRFTKQFLKVAVENKSMSQASSGKTPLRAFARNLGLTEREQEILQYLLEGNSQQEISEKLVIAIGTVKTHIHNIYQKAGAANRGQLSDLYQQFCTNLSSAGTQAEDTNKYV